MQVADVSKYFRNNATRKRAPENFVEETANMEFEGKVQVECWINLKTATSGENATLHWSNTQFILQSKDEIIQRFPFTDVKSAQVSPVTSPAGRLSESTQFTQINANKHGFWFVRFWVLIPFI
jgi:hypothetical protein